MVEDALEFVDGLHQGGNEGSNSDGKGAPFDHKC